MKEVLPARGISLTEIPRLEDQNGEVISAGRVRNLIRSLDGKAQQERDEILGRIRGLVPPTTYEVILQRV